MSLIESFKTALQTLRQHKLRSVLTMLGVIIGVMAVALISQVSNGFQYFITNEFGKLGANTITIAYSGGNRNERVKNIDGLKLADVQYLRDRVSTLEIVTPTVQVPSQKVTAAERTVDDPRIFGTDHENARLNNVGIKEGRQISEQDVRQRANVCVIGEEIASRLFPGQSPLGKYVAFADITLEVVGVSSRLDLMGGTNARDVYVPISTVQDKWIGGDNLMMITAKPKDGVKLADAMQATWEALMLKSGNRRIYRVDSSENILAVFNNLIRVSAGVLGGIAALSLLVGGIGIMNIMLVSVSERTREIGLRKAVGAKQGAIMLQFMVESATLSLVGGLIGMGIAWMIGKGVTLATAAVKWPSAAGLPAVFPLPAALSAALLSAAIGVIFGLYPAISAARLDPIVALRRE